jgi:hypothetical protein
VAPLRPAPSSPCQHPIAKIIITDIHANRQARLLQGNVLYSTSVEERKGCGEGVDSMHFIPRPQYRFMPRSNLDQVSF